MNFNQLKHFICVAELKSFSEASKHLSLTQPSLSTSIKKLEVSLGVKLFERNHKQLSLTVSGIFLLERGKILTCQFDSLKREICSKNSNQKTLTIAIDNKVLSVIIGKLIYDFSLSYPDVVVEQLNGNVTKMKNLLNKNELDALIKIKESQHSVEMTQTLFLQQYLLAVSKDHSWAKRKSISLKELDKESYIDRLKCSKRCYLHNLFARKSINPEFNYRIANEQVCNLLVANNMGVAVMPVQAHTSSAIEYIPFSDLNLTSRVELVWKPGNCSKALSKFRDFCISNNQYADTKSDQYRLHKGASPQP